MHIIFIVLYLLLCGAQQMFMGQIICSLDLVIPSFSLLKSFEQFLQIKGINYK